MTEGKPAPTIGRYELVTRLATGGMAELFLARERGLAGLERLVVIKRILPHLADQPKFVDMFLREARIVAKLSHPNIVQIYDLGNEDGTYYLAMEYIHGSTVREIQVLADASQAQFPLDVCVGIVTRALKGLHAAHEMRDMEGNLVGLVHRDVSPHNLMCTTEGHVKLLDFGVAKATEGVENTYSGNLKGKFAYMSPEQAKREVKLDRRSDVFSMGIVAWELLTGQRLFKRSNELDMMQAVISCDVPAPSTIRDDLPEHLEQVLYKALERERELRFDTADTMRLALVDFADRQGLDITGDRIAGFVHQVAGDQLEVRSETLQAALERSLTSNERRGLLHATGSETFESLADTEVGAGVAPEPSVPSSAEGASGQSAETVVARHRRQQQEREPAPDATANVGGGERASTRSRWPILAGVVAVIAAAAVAGIFVLTEEREGAAASEEPASSDTVLLGDPVHISWAPTVDPELLADEIEPLDTYLEEELGRPVELKIGESYGESSRKVIEGEADFAVLPPLTYVRTKAKEPGIEPLVLKEYDGATHSDGLLLVRGDSSYRSLDDLEGTTFCFTDENSTSGNFLPRAYIRRAGHDPDAFIGRVRWTGDHIQGLRDLMAGECDAAATYSGAMLSSDQLGLQMSKIRTLAITGNIPQDTVVAGPDVPGSDRVALETALLAFDAKETLGKEYVGQTQRITAFREIDDDAFDDLRQVIADDAVRRSPADAGE